MLPQLRSRPSGCRSRTYGQPKSTYQRRIPMSSLPNHRVGRIVVLSAMSAKGWPERWRAVILLIASLASVSNGCGARNKSAKTPVHLVMSSQVYSQTPVILAQALGYFEAESLTVRIENIQSNSKA